MSSNKNLINYACSTQNKNLATRINRFLRRTIQYGRSAYALLFGYGFECKHLSGGHKDSEMGIVINSDLSVTCNSDDMYGHGQLGSLRISTMKELLDGDKANSFRHHLANGILPIPECSNCPGLNMVRRSKVRPTNFMGELSSILIENTAKCNVSCLSCDRSAIKNNRSELTMSEADVRMAVKAVSEYKIDHVRLLNLGEPFASSNIFLMTKDLRRAFPCVQITSSSNGSLLKGQTKLAAMMNMNEVTFTIPGSDQASVETYQVGQNFSQTYANICEAVKHRDSLGSKHPIIIWKYLIFKWNDSDTKILEAIKLAAEAKVDRIRFVVCVSPLYGISLKYLLGKKIPAIPMKQINSQRQHQLELIRHRHMYIDFIDGRPSESTDKAKIAEGLNHVKS